MSSQLCGENVDIQLTSQVVSSERVVEAMEVEGLTEMVGVVGSNGAGEPGGVELGRRLLLAARAGDATAVHDLMAKGAPFTTDWLGTSALHLAAANDHAETCAVLLRAGISRDARTKTERTALHLAAHAGAERATKLLLKWGALPSAADLLRMTPLHWAAARGHLGTARALLAGGADPRARCKFRKVPRDHAARHHHADLVALLGAAEAAADAAALAEQMADDSPKEPEVPIIHRLSDLKGVKPKIIEVNTSETSKPQVAGAGVGAGGGAGAALLRRHGITLLPADDGSTVLNALQSGRTIVLSDAGKLMLKESGAVEASTGGEVGGASNKAGVVVRARAVRLGAGQQQVKLVQLPPDAKLVSGGGRGPGPGVGSGKAKGRPAVKIIMNKANFTKLIANARPANATSIANVANTANVVNVLTTTATLNNQTVKLVGGGVPAAEGVESAGDVDSVGEGESADTLRVRLRAALRALAAVSADLRDARARLANYEPL